MLQRKFCAAVTSALALSLVGCSGDDVNSTPEIQFTSQVVFGDSLSDVGSYAVGGVAALGGGLYTVNSTLSDGSLAPLNWTSLVASDLNLPAPCPAETGLAGIEINPIINFNITPVFHTPTCTNYAMGGSRVTDPFGPGNASLPDFLGGSAVLGQLTVPIVTQIQNHLDAHGGSFSGTEIVFILAGGNDTIVNTLTYVATVGQALQTGGLPAGEAAAATAAPTAIQANGAAGAALAGYINNSILGKGAKYIVVLTMPDLSTTPFGVQSESLIPIPGTQSLMSTLVQTFNSNLKANLTNSSNILVADLYTASVEQLANPAEFGLSNVTDTACDLNSDVNLLGSSLVCNHSNLNPGDVSRYAFADTVHPTPYSYGLIALFVTGELFGRGWL